MTAAWLEGTGTALVAYGLFAATEHVFLLVPPLFLPLGLILLRTAILPRVFALLAVTFGVIAPFLGLAGLFAVTANNNGPVGTAIKPWSPPRPCGSSRPR
jgi:hypothetical protein